MYKYNFIFHDSPSINQSVKVFLKILFFYLSSVGTEGCTVARQHFLWFASVPGDLNPINIAINTSNIQTKYFVISYITIVCVFV